MDEEDQQQSGGSGITAWISNHAPLAILIAVVAAIVLFAFLTNRKANQAQTSTTQDGATGDLSGLATDANGNHIVYLPVEDYYNNINTITGSYNNPVTSTNTTTTTDTSVVNPPPPTPAPVTPPVVMPPPQHVGTTIAWIVPYTVQAGDTLRSIAEMVGDRGTQTSSAAIYSHNKHTIDMLVASNHGRSMQLYPGEHLILPAVVYKGGHQLLPFESGLATNG
jgi:hypothetical protein